MIGAGPVVAPGWDEWCRAQGLDPAEVRLVLGRYRAYRLYYESGRRGEPLPLENWFTFYRMETASEVEQNAPTASGCSVDPNARNRGAISRPAEFLQALVRLASQTACNRAP
ncbi:hypothetical protein GPROT2_00438 [Gammaproteobacteria bacterium]|nr:hypothetical protein [Gammaproteobacteria bacterium]QOJ31173.1 MAG: hypothetical protein HRU81_03105 [Gammaproteobacteria bacterium]CAG0938894.1 hypothetical protein GPROT2_00438 [Gammaproteobacteria bacterium]